MGFAIVYQRYHRLRLYFTVDSYLCRPLTLTDGQLILAAAFPIVKRHLRPVRR
ncbi:hypothetical protein D3C80_1677960 [compost metagenome]